MNGNGKLQFRCVVVDRTKHHEYLAFLTLIAVCSSIIRPLNFNGKEYDGQANCFFRILYFNFNAWHIIVWVIQTNNNNNSNNTKKSAGLGRTVLFVHTSSPLLCFNIDHARHIHFYSHFHILHPNIFRCFRKMIFYTCG